MAIRCRARHNPTRSRARVESRLMLATPARLLTTTLALLLLTPDDQPTPVSQLVRYLAVPPEQRPPLQEQTFATVPLSKSDAAEAAKLLWQDHVARIRQSRAAEMNARELTAGDLRMPF